MIGNANQPSGEGNGLMREATPQSHKGKNRVRAKRGKPQLILRLRKYRKYLLSLI